MGVCIPWEDKLYWKQSQQIKIKKLHQNSTDYEKMYQPEETAL